MMAGCAAASGGLCGDSGRFCVGGEEAGADGFAERLVGDFERLAGLEGFLASGRHLAMPPELVRLRLAGLLPSGRLRRACEAGRTVAT